MNIFEYEEKAASFAAYLKEAERTESTVIQYLREVRFFAAWFSLGGGEVRPVTREDVIAYKQYLKENYAPSSVNTKLAALGSYFDFLSRPDLKVRPLKIQKKTYQDPEKELTKAEYIRLVERARKEGDERLSLILQALCSTGIRVSELSFLTCEAVRAGKMTVNLKGKSRLVFLPSKLCRLLKAYMKKAGIRSGVIFCGRSGRPLNRTTIWRMMKRLSLRAGVSPEKVFPHNLRHLFACCFYRQEKDISKLADVLGHSNLNTTRIYIISSGREHRKKIEALRLVI